MDKNGKKEDAGGIIPKAPNKFNKIFNKIIIPQPNPITMPSSFFCLIEAPKINITNNLKSYEYFEHLLTVISEYMEDTDRKFLEELLPWLPALPENIRK